MMKRAIMAVTLSVGIVGCAGSGADDDVGARRQALATEEEVLDAAIVDEAPPPPADATAVVDATVTEDAAPESDMCTDGECICEVEEFVWCDLPEECCLQDEALAPEVYAMGTTETSTTTDGGTTCAAPKKGPIPGDKFECPVGKPDGMKYCHNGTGYCSDPKCHNEDNNDDHFDCDDYSHACVVWCHQQGYNCCQIDYAWENATPKPSKCKCCGKDLSGKYSAHAIVSAEFKDKYCLVDPQGNTIYCCWAKDQGAINKPPQSCLDKACAAFGAKPGTCKLQGTACDLKPLPNAGEKPFYTRKSVCDQLKKKCGIVYPPPGTKDSDGDGIPDNLDKCNKTPAQWHGSIITDPNSPYYGCYPNGDTITGTWG